MLKGFSAWATIAFVGVALLAACSGKREAEAAAEETGRPADTIAPAAIIPEAGEGDAPAGEALLQTRCTVCHNLDRVYKEKETREGWEKIVDEMIEKGAKLSDAEKGTVVDYLAENYHP